MELVAHISTNRLRADGIVPCAKRRQHRRGKKAAAARSAQIGRKLHAGRCHDRPEQTGWTDANRLLRIKLLRSAARQQSWPVSDT